MLYLKILDIVRGYAERAYIAVDGIHADGYRSYVAHLATQQHRDIGHTATQIDNNGTILHILGAGHREVRHLGIGDKLLDGDALTLKTLAQTITHRLIAEDEVIGGRQNVAIRAHRHIHLALIDLIAHRLHREYHLAVIGQLDTTHAAIQLIEITLRNLVAAIAELVLNVDMVGELHAADKVTRQTGIGLRDAHIEHRLYLLLGGSNSLTHHITILDMSCVDTRDRLRDDAASHHTIIIHNFIVINCSIEKSII